MKLVCFAINLFFLLALSSNQAKAIATGSNVSNNQVKNECSFQVQNKRKPIKDTRKISIIHFHFPCPIIQNFAVTKAGASETRSFDKTLNANYVQHHNIGIHSCFVRKLSCFKPIAYQQYSCSRLQRFNL